MNRQRQCRPSTNWYHLLFFFCCVHSRILIQITLGEAAGITSPDFSPSAFSYRQTNNQDHDSKDDDDDEINLGTTLVAIKFKGGVVVGADTRTSVGGYVSNKFAFKINPILDTNQDQDPDDDETSERLSSSCVLCRSGSAADTQWLAKLAKRRFEARKLERPSYYTPTVSEVAHYLRYQMRNSNHGFQASLICAGYEQHGGRIFGITPGGSLWEEDNFCVSGSGSTILLGYLDDLKQSMDAAHDFSSVLNKTEAVNLVTKLLKLSIGRDGSSGGLVRLYVIDQNGVQEQTVYPTIDNESSLLESNSDSVDKGKTLYTGLPGFATPERK